MTSASIRHRAMLLAAASTMACSGARLPHAETGADGAVPRGTVPPPPDPVAVYRRLGLIAHGGALPFVGRVAYLAGPTADTTLAVLTLGLPSRALSFTHTGADYRAAYRVDGTVTAHDAPRDAPHIPPVATIAAAESVTVATFRETTRDDESLLFQQVLRLAPGRYRLALQVRDQGSLRAVSDTSALDVPTLGANAVATPLPFHELIARVDRAALPRIVASPRATVTYGRDSSLALYLETYAAASPRPGASGDDTGTVALRILVRTEDGHASWQDTVRLARGDGLAAGVVRVPVTELGIGPATVEASRLDDARHTARAPVFVSFGDDLPAATFADMLNYLRFYASPARLERLRRTPPSARAEAWSDFLLATDPDPVTPGHQGLQQYFARIQVANQRYREDAGPGWLTDRGMVYAALGDPDQVHEPTMATFGDRNRVQVWIYRAQRLQLELRDRTGFDRWDLTPSSRVAFIGALGRMHP